MLNELINDNNYHLHLDALQVINKVKYDYYVRVCNFEGINLSVFLKWSLLDCFFIFLFLLTFSMVIKSIQS